MHIKGLPGIEFSVIVEDDVSRPIKFKLIPVPSIAPLAIYHEQRGWHIWTAMYAKSFRWGATNMWPRRRYQGLMGGHQADGWRAPSLALGGGGDHPADVIPSARWSGLVYWRPRVTELFPGCRMVEEKELHRDGGR